MPSRMPEDKLRAIEYVVLAHPDGVGVRGIHGELGEDVPRRTLQYRLNRLVEEGRLVKEGERRAAKYFPPAPLGERKPSSTPAGESVDGVLVSRRAGEIQRLVRRPLLSRKPTGYKRAFLDEYTPNETFYLTKRERGFLRKIGAPPIGKQPAGSYAKQILDKLLIDLSWNSSRLEGNTYSLTETHRLISFGVMADGRDRLEAQMILNHKRAIEFLVDSAGDAGFERRTLLNLHAMLADGLLADRAAAGRLRRMAVGIGMSSFHPTEIPHLIEECFDLTLAKAGAIEDPYEQALFVMIQVPYLQPFDDVNKRVSRLAANVPFIRENLIPLSFVDVPPKIYAEAMLGVYELNQIDLIKDVFIWAYERSAVRYAEVRQLISEPDPFLMKHSAMMREIINDIIIGKLDRKTAFVRIAERAETDVEPGEQDRFREMAEMEALGIHEGNFARYRVTSAQFDAWEKVWNAAGERDAGGGGR